MTDQTWITGSPRRIGIVGPFAPWMSGGASVHAAEMVRAIGPSYWFKVVTPGGFRHHPVPRNVRVVPMIPYLTTAGTTGVAVMFFKGIDLVHAHDCRFSIVKRILQRPLVTTFHGYLTLEAVANRDTREGSYLYAAYETLVREAVELSDALIAVDQRISDWLRRDFAASHVSLIHNAVDVERFKPGIDGGALRASLGIPRSRLLVLGAKHFVQKNGLENAVRAMPMVVRDFPNAMLLLAGDGPLRSLISRAVSETQMRDHVMMPGQLPHTSMAEVVSACDICIVPSISVAGVEEATSIIALEAMACGKPVVASSLGGLQEIISDGSTGFLVPPGNPEALASCINTLLANPELRQEMGARARAQVVRRHSWQSVVKTITSIYDSLLAA